MFLHVEEFRLTMGVDNAKQYKCLDLTNSSRESMGITEKILTFSDIYTSLNTIEIFNTGEEALKVYEFKIMGMTIMLPLIKIVFIEIFILIITFKFDHQMLPLFRFLIFTFVLYP